jgi:hypothetical protein
MLESGRALSLGLMQYVTTNRLTLLIFERWKEAVKQSYVIFNNDDAAARSVQSCIKSLTNRILSVLGV